VCYLSPILNNNGFELLSPNQNCHSEQSEESPHCARCAAHSTLAEKYNKQRAMSSSRNVYTVVEEKKADSFASLRNDK
jgi:predicted ATP-dependent serine protease